jgi:hypothetical protein
MVNLSKYTGTVEEIREFFKQNYYLTSNLIDEIFKQAVIEENVNVAKAVLEYYEKYIYDYDIIHPIIYLSLENINNHYDFLTNIISSREIFKNVIGRTEDQLREFNYSKFSDQIYERNFSLQTHLLNKLLNNKIEIEGLKFTSSSVKGIFNFKELLLDHPAATLSPDSILKEISKAFINDEEVFPKWNELIRFLVERKANPNSVDFLGWNHITLETYDILLKNGLNANNLLMYVLNKDISVFNYESYKYTDDESLKTAKNSIIEKTLSYINLEDIDYSTLPNIPLEVYDLFVNKGLDVNKFLVKTLKNSTIYIKDYQEKIIEKSSAYNVKTENIEYVPSYLSLESYRLLLKHGCDANIIFRNISISSELPLEIYDILLQHGLNANILLVKAFDIRNGDLREKLQCKLIEKAITHGADINKNYKNLFHLSLSVESIELLLKNGLDAQELFNKTILLDAKEYDYGLHEYVDRSSDILLILEKAIASGANVNLIYYSYVKLPLQTWDFLLEKGLNANKLLEAVLNSSSYNIPVASTAESDVEQLKFQLIEKAISYKADINKVFKDNTYKLADLELNIINSLLDKGLNPEYIVKGIINNYFTVSYEEKDGEFVIFNFEKNKVKNHLGYLKLAIEKGAKNLNAELINNSYYVYPAELIEFVSTDKPEELDQILFNVLKRNAYPSFNSDNPKVHSSVTENDKQIINLLTEKGASLDSIEFKEKLYYGQVDKELIIYAFDKGLNPNKLLSIILKFYQVTEFTYKDNHAIRTINQEKVVVKKELVNLAFEKGAHLDEISFGDLDIDELDIEILKTLIEHGLDPNTLILSNLDKDDALDILKLATEKDVRIPTFTLMTALFENDNPEVLKYIIENGSTKLNQKIDIDTLIEEIKSYGPKFKEYIEKDLNKMVNFKDTLNAELAYNGTVLHILAKANKKELLKFVLEELKAEVNVFNDKNQTPLFFANRPEIIELLVNNGADTTLKDVDGNIWIQTPSLDIINYAIEKGYLPKDHSLKAFKNHFLKGNYEHAAKIFKIGVDIESDIIDDFIQAVETGLKNSVENNKYHAIINLMHKAGITIPEKFNHLVHNINDKISTNEFEFINGLLHKLATYYINQAKLNFSKELGKNCLTNETKEYLDHAFSKANDDRYFDFVKIKEACPDNKELIKVETELDAYYKVIGEALNILDNDFALEVLTINGMRPTLLDEDITIYRGLKANIGEDDINSWFKYGIRAFSVGEFQKTLGYYVKQPWNEVSGRWEYGGTYVSLEPSMSAGFAGGMTAHIDAESIFLEMRLPKGSPRICGSWHHEYELIPSNIDGDNVVAVYKLYKDQTDSKFKVITAIKNPYLAQGVEPRYKAGDAVEYDKDAVETYNKLGCKEQKTITGANFSAKFKNYEEFIAVYTADLHLQDQELLVKDYFADRLHYDYIHSSTPTTPIIGLDEYCNPEIACCN